MNWPHYWYFDKMTSVLRLRTGSEGGFIDIRVCYKSTDLVLDIDKLWDQVRGGRHGLAFYEDSAFSWY